jgi:hypothetical protein
MRRRVLLCFVLALASGCRGGDAARPIADPSAPPSRSISDATHSSGNPDFFFLPPMVSNPSASPMWDAGAFNGTLKPMVRICAIAGPSTMSGDTPCVTDALSSTPAALHLSDEMYQLNWKVPDDAGTTYYRIMISVGTTVLGWADVETASSMSQLKNVNTGEMVPLVDGRALPIKVRIERYALCEVPGTGPCGSSSIDLATGGTVTTVLEEGGQVSGVTIPAQDPGSPTTTITVQGCDDINPRATDLPIFGPCLSVTASPALPPDGLGSAATVFICDVSEASVLQGGQVADEDQAHRITLHRVDPDPDPSHAGGYVVAALPHVAACAANLSSREPTLGGLVAALRHGRLREAAHQAMSLLSPKPLYAARYIDLGGGGSSSFFSDFQFALPASMEIVPATNDQSAELGTMVPFFPTVKVTDLGGAPVRGATVHFSTSDGALTASEATTDEKGLAQVGWTLGFTASNSLTASGRGLAGTDANGPRADLVDPFQPIQSFFDGASATPSGAVPVLEGSVLFSATGTVFATSFEPPDASWLDDATRGFWHTSALRATNSLSPSLVHPASGDHSAGALPAPFAGANALWFGNEGGDPSGNYVGTLASPTETGGTSTEPHSGVTVSPVFLVPDVPAGLSVQLDFQSWFEIESVNPSRFDVMEVSVHDADANTTALLTRLNPASDPAGGNSTTPYTSGGFDQPPRWVTVTQDLTAYKGHHVQLTFSFSTGDVLYNGFRGWVVDDLALRVNSTPAIATRIPLRGASLDVVGASPPPARSWHP